MFGSDKSLQRQIIAQLREQKCAAPSRMHSMPLGSQRWKSKLPYWLESPRNWINWAATIE